MTSKIKIGSWPLDYLSRTAVVMLLLFSLVAMPALAAPVVATQDDDDDDDNESVILQSSVDDDDNETTTQAETVDGKAPFYSDETGEVDNETWMADREDATLSNVIHYATRFGSFIIGSEPGATDGSTNAIVVGMIVAGGLLGVTVGTGVGIVGGGTLAMASLSALIAVDLAPEWFWAVALFGIALFLSASVKRMLA